MQWDLDRLARLVSIPARLRKGTGAAHVTDSAANKGNLFDLRHFLANQIVSRN
jgi:hypothetical protein